uniref:Uncharacterized protein n=1 Tax=Gorilla gorilla gorilla TaxID=9595 RepID=A0A2I2Y662_GORGO
MACINLHWEVMPSKKILLWGSGQNVDYFLMLCSKAYQLKREYQHLPSLGFEKWN